jgi:hypothetical protein
MTCEKCGGTGFLVVEGRGYLVPGMKACPAEYSGVIPCECSKTRQSIALEHARKQLAQFESGPLITADDAMEAVRKLETGLNWFPKGKEQLTFVGDGLARMCRTKFAAMYVVARACELYQDWRKCGLMGLRQILTAKVLPREGPPIYTTDAYPEGLPEAPQKPIPEFKTLELPPGCHVTENRKLDAAITEALPNFTMADRRPVQSLQSPPKAEKPAPAPMSEERRAELQAMVDKAQEEVRAKKTAAG